MRKTFTFILLVLLAAVAFSTPSARAVSQFDESILPPCWSLASTYRADPATLAGFGQRFGADLESLFNYKIDAAGIPLQVNIITCRTIEGAETVFRYFMGARGANAQKYQRVGQVVYEFLCDNYGVSAKAKDALGVRRTYRRLIELRAGVAPLDSSDGMKWNALYNAITGGDAGAVAELAPAFEFGNVLRLRGGTPDWGVPSYEFSVKPVSREVNGDVVAFTFEDLPRTQGVPRLAMTATVPVISFTAYRPAQPVNVYRLTRPTAAWPTEHPLVKTALEGLDPGWTEAEKIEWIHCRVFQSIRYDGDVTGSRYGTAAVLEQGFGHCWDKADVFVTLCRAAGVAAREVMGWLGVVETGHVWAQAWDPERGWVSVDATASWVGVDERYIPLAILEDGRTPFVYTSTPEWIPLAPQHRN